MVKFYWLLLMLSAAIAYPLTFGGFDSSNETDVLQLSFDDIGNFGVILNTTETAIHGIPSST